LEQNDTTKITSDSCARDQLVFDKSIVLDSVVTQFGLTCDHQIVRSIFNSLYLFGMLIGSFVIGLVSDRFGRLKVKGAIMYEFFRNLQDMFRRVHNMYPHTIIYFVSCTLDLCSPYVASEMTNINLFQKIQIFPKNTKFSKKAKICKKKTHFGSFWLFWQIWLFWLFLKILAFCIGPILAFLANFGIFLAFLEIFGFHVAYI
jgi:hypothetical protein